MPSPTLDQRLRSRDRPPRGPVMYQRWTDLLFLHWRWDPAEIQTSLPAGLTVDTHDGAGWMGVVPFWMEAVRPRGLPVLPGLSWFLELNLRTYVHDERGEPGVWFYSLDCNQPIATTVARTLFGLNYVHARQTGQHPAATAASREFHSVRRTTGGSSHFAWTPTAGARSAEPGSLDFFLVERYRLFATHRHRLRCGRVWHPPYGLAGVDLHRAETRLWIDQGWPDPDRPPDHVTCSPGVNVSIYPLQTIS